MESPKFFKFNPHITSQENKKKVNIYMQAETGKNGNHFLTIDEN